MSLMLRGKSQFGLGQFVEAAGLFKKAQGKMSSVDASLRAELERQCTVWNNKSQIELTSTRSYGDINMGAYLNTSAPQNPSMFTPSAPADGGAKASSKPVAKQEEAKTAAPSGPAAINVNYDWYQNMTHVFVAYKIKSGGAEL